MKNIFSILRAHRWKIAVIYFYIICGQLLFVMEPYFLGRAIDGLLQKNCDWVWLLLLAHLGENAFMYKQMVYDIRVYTQVYNEIVYDYLRRDIASDTSTKIARTDMLHVVIDFIEHHLHYYVSAVMTIIGSLYFVFIQHSLTGWIMLGSMPFIALWIWVFYKKMAHATRIGNTHYEQKAGVMESKDDSRIDTFFKRRRRVIIGQSTIHAKHWFSMNTTKTVFLILALIVFTNGSVGLSHGAAISIYTYINQFLASLMSVPIFVEVYARIRDVIKRIENC